MGISFSIPFDPCINKISHWLDERIACVHDLKKNLTALVTTMEELKAKRDDWSRRITREEDRGFQRLAEVQVWLTRVETIEKEVNDLLSARDVELQKLCLCGFCSYSLKSSYRYGRSVILKLRKVEKLKGQVFDVLVEQAQTSEVQEQQIKPAIVGQEKMLDKAWKHLKEDGVGIMGFYGMGGVGKTTLLTQINNKFSEERCGFDFVIWVVVSKDLQLDNIQEEVAEKAGLDGEDWRRKVRSRKTEDIYNFLRKKRFVLFLDDIWEKVDLTKIGIPIPTTKNKCKVAFTTRSQDVCARMGVENPMEVQCLSDNDAFDLFQKKVGKITLGSDPEIPSLARIVARKCHGLPLALDVIGETMSCKRTTQEWHHAIDILTSYAIEFSGMEEKILPLLKYSYDNLKGEKVQSCLLYCALFPEDYKILKETLVDYWIGEGIIDASEGIERAENKGYEIIGSLVRASLLIGPHGTESVCMHDVVREMALWIASDLGRQKEAFFVRARAGLRKMPKVKSWKVVKRMSLSENEIGFLPGMPRCPELKTFLMKSARVKRISSEFFEYMPKLVVLDLSHNDYLSELPNGISKLVSLQYLNLSWTSELRDLRLDLLQELKKLIHLDLTGTLELSSIAGISRLLNLKILKLFHSGFSWDRDTVEELENLKHLEILTTGFKLSQDFEQFVSSYRLMSCTRSIQFWDMRTWDKPYEISLPVAMDKLRDFSIRKSSVYEIKMEHNPRSPRFLSLSYVMINECDCLRELTLLMFAPNLKNLHVFQSNELEDIINKDIACRVDESGIVPFQKLVSLKLDNLRELKNIYWNPLPFPYLQEIYISQCPNLKKLPLDSQSGKQGEDGLIITYTERRWIDAVQWIDGVEWEDDATKARFLSSCEEVSLWPKP